MDFNQSTFDRFGEKALSQISRKNGREKRDNIKSHWDGPWQNRHAAERLCQSSLGSGHRMFDTSADSSESIGLLLEMRPFCPVLFDEDLYVFARLSPDAEPIVDSLTFEDGPRIGLFAHWVIKPKLF